LPPQSDVHPETANGRSDVVLGGGCEAVEADAGVGGGVGTGREDVEVVAGGEGERQVVVGLVVEDVGGVAGRPGESDRSAWFGVVRSAYRVADGFVESFREAAETAAVDVDPACGSGRVATEHDFGAGRRRRRRCSGPVR
jgi:hypothetical protein